MDDAESTPKVADVRQLPTISKLPPLEIPSNQRFSDDTFDSSLFIGIRDRDDETRSGSTHASEDSFATACTSSPIASPTSFAALIAIPPPPPRSSCILAKSTSVDSFVKDRSPGTPVVVTNPYSRSPLKKTFRDSVIDPDMDRWRTQRQSTHTPSLGSQKPPSSFVQNKFLQRTRATSKFMMTGADSEDSMYEDSEAELSAASTSKEPIRRRLMSIREASRAHGAGSAPPLSTTVSLTSLTAAHLADRSQARPTGFSNGSVRSDPSSSLALDSTRARSQSLGAQLDAHSRRNPSRLVTPMVTNAVEKPV